ncbi:MAG: S8 family serine peptidase [Myxococcales bacterium]|nr:S8 family serine peptidase [Myxococcales bacterium]
MWRVLCSLFCLATLACVSPAPTAPLARPPAAPERPQALRIEPARIALPLGQAASLRVRGSAAGEARCSSSEGALPRLPDGRLSIASPSGPGVVEVSCQSDTRRAFAQVTFTTARVLPLRDPYAGGVVLFKLRRAPVDPHEPRGRQTLGLPTLDRLLSRLGGYAFPAFPFERSATLDRVGLDRWIAIELPETVNYYEAVRLLRADRQVLPESYWPEDGDYLRVEATESWPIALTRPQPAPSSGLRPAHASKLAPVSATEAFAAGKLGWELQAIGLPRAWVRGRGAGVGVAIIDTGVDLNHVAIARNLRSKRDETLSFDADGNGIPGDEAGVNLAHLAIARGTGAPRLSLGLLANVSDWSGADAHLRPSLWGHGTAIAALAAGTGDADGRLGVAPEAWILPVDIQENLRATRSRLLEEDPRMRLLPGTPVAFSPLRSPLWARAAGVAYAVREGVRVLTCAWPPLEPAWMLHDALQYAEDNCVLAVCADSEDPSGTASSPARWRASRDARHTGVYDAWAGTVRPDFFERPLRGLVWAAGLEGSPAPVPGAGPDLLVSLHSRAGDPIRSAASNPRNDSGPLPDRRSMAFARPGAAAGLVAGAALLISARRPDLEPLTLRNALLDGARNEQGRRVLWIPGALEAAERRPQGRCVQRDEVREQAWWERMRLRASKPGPDPAEPATEISWP